MRGKQDVVRAAQENTDPFPKDRPTLRVAEVARVFSCSTKQIRRLVLGGYMEAKFINVGMERKCFVVVTDSARKYWSLTSV